MKIEDRLYLNTWKKDTKSHLKVIDFNVCAEKCLEKYCNTFCPANVYVWNEEEKKMEVGFESCLECGTCRIGCIYKNIEWNPPRGGFGIQYRYG